MGEADKDVDRIPEHVLYTSRAHIYIYRIRALLFSVRAAPCLAACALCMDWTLSLIFLQTHTHIPAHKCLYARERTTTIKSDTVDGRPHLHAYPLLHIPYLHHWHLKTMRYRTLTHTRPHQTHLHSCTHTARNEGKKHKRLNTQRFCIDNYSDIYKSAHIYTVYVCIGCALTEPCHIYTPHATRHTYIINVICIQASGWMDKIIFFFFVHVKCMCRFVTVLCSVRTLFIHINNCAYFIAYRHRHYDVVSYIFFYSSHVVGIEIGGALSFINLLACLFLSSDT